MVNCGGCGDVIDVKGPLPNRMIAVIFLYLDEDREQKHLICPDCGTKIAQLVLKIRDAKEIKHDENTFDLHGSGDGWLWPDSDEE